MFKVTKREFNHTWYTSSVMIFKTFKEALASLGSTFDDLIEGHVIHEVVLGDILTCQEFDTAWGRTREKATACCFFQGSRGGYGAIEQIEEVA